MSEEENKSDLIESEQTPQEGDAATPPVETDVVTALRTQLDEALRLSDTFKDQMLRKAAEFENYKRRVESESAAIMRSANEGVLLSLLPVVDDLSRSLKVGRDHKDFEAFYSGVEMIYAKFQKVLERFGVTPFDSVGKPFDVDLHDALLQVPRADVEPHTVVEEVERGYMLFDRVLRHAKVIVSTSTGEPEASDGQA